MKFSIIFEMTFKVLLFIILTLLHATTAERIHILLKIKPPSAGKLLGLGPKTQPDIPLPPYSTACRPIGL